jgi:hypothetical protein
MGGLVTLHVVPDPADVYGYVEFMADTRSEPVKLSIAVGYGDDPGTDIVLGPDGWVCAHPYHQGRWSTEEERAAVGWTW